jgi:sterol desaturase/sphingolipid hydroxylase (fatty acid hydroxylase superfamily)
MTIILVVAACAALMFLVELAKPGRQWPQVTGWWVRAGILNLIQIGAVFVAGAGWDRWMPGRSLWSLEHLSLSAQVLIGYLTITFIYYWWHRFRHESSLLWRLFHQVHHSPQRIEIVTSFYKHPFEILINSILSSAILYLVCGISPEAAGITVLITGVAELFYHWNVSTPYWIGFLFQRPESHCVHHEQGHHQQNFSDLPLWDMLFGTFNNPRSWTANCGFSEDRETQLGAMLLTQDVNESASKKNAPGGSAV